MNFLPGGAPYHFFCFLFYIIRSFEGMCIRGWHLYVGAHSPRRWLGHRRTLELVPTASQDLLAQFQTVSGLVAVDKNTPQLLLARVLVRLYLHRGRHPPAKPNQITTGTVVCAASTREASV